MFFVLTTVNLQFGFIDKDLQDLHMSHMIHKIL